MASFDDVVIISGCRTPVGKFQGSLSDFSAPQLGAIVVREAVKRAGIDPDADRRVHHGQRRLCWTRAKSRAPGRHLWRIVSRDRCHDNQQSLRFRIESCRARSASDANRKQFHRRRRRNGIDDQRSLSFAASAQRISPGQRADRRLHGARRPLGYLQRLPHGHHRRERRRKIWHHARTAGRVCASTRIAKRSPRSKNAASNRRLFRSRFRRRRKATPHVIFDKDESPREDTTIEVLRALKPAFKKDGTVTAGNAPGVNDGAAALVVTSATRAQNSARNPWSASSHRQPAASIPMGDDGSRRRGPHRSGKKPAGKMKTWTFTN